MGKCKDNDNRPSLNSPILAAGTVLWLKKVYNSDIPIIQRPHYGSEWCLPKGKVREGETFEEVALRKVKEILFYSILTMFLKTR